MNRKQFLEGFEPILVPINGRKKLVVSIRGNVARNVIKYSKHVLYKRQGRPPAIAKEDWVYNDYIRRRCNLWEVFDIERNIILRTTTANFDAHCEPWPGSTGRQLLMEEPFWQIERVGEPQPVQGSFF